MHVYDVATGKEIDTPIPRVQFPTAGGSLAWTADGNGFWYTRYPGDEAPEADRHFNMQVYFHSSAPIAKTDALVLGAKDGLERVSEVFLDNRYRRHADPCLGAARRRRQMGVLRAARERAAGAGRDL